MQSHLFEKFGVSQESALHVKQDIVLWTNSQRPPDDVHFMADVHTFYVNGARGWWEQASQDRSDKHQIKKKNKNMSSDENLQPFHQDK